MRLFYRACGLAVLLTLCSSPRPARAQDGPTVVYVSGNDLVVKTAEGKLLNYSIPLDYRFAVAGKQVPLSGVKAGTVLAQKISTSDDPVPVTGVKVVKAKVYAVTPPDGITLLLAEGVKELVVPAGTVFTVNGKPMPLAELKPEMMVEATIVTTGASPDGASSATPPMAGALLLNNTAGAGADLPMTATSLPLAGILGLCLLALGAALMLFRSPARRIG